MVKNRIPNDGRHIGYAMLVMEKMRVNRDFPHFQTQLRGLQLICTGRTNPSDESQQYKIQIAYAYDGAPQCRILEPQIAVDPQIHMYKNGTLCLYDWREQSWNPVYHLSETVIPWIAEWLVYYELFQMTGRWLGKAASHDEPKQEPAAEKKQPSGT